MQTYSGYVSGESGSERIDLSAYAKMRSLVVTGLGYSKAEGAADLLKTLASDPSEEVRIAAGKAIEKIKAR